MIVVMKPANKARGTVWRSWWSEASHPRENRKIQHTPDAEPDFVCHMDGPVTAMGWLADPLTSCAAARPEGGAGCLSGHVRICAGVPGKPGAYRDENGTEQTRLRHHNAPKALYRYAFELGPLSKDQAVLPPIFRALNPSSRAKVAAS